MSQHDNDKPIALTIAGLDPSGGAGVIADIRTFTSFACLSTAAITSITFQNDSEVQGAEHLSPATLRAQVTSSLRQHSITGAKTGMLPTSEIVREVAHLFRETSLPAPVVDPVMRSSSGFSLIEEGAVETMLEELLPLARIITPNIPEGERLTGLRIVDEAGMRCAAEAIRAMGARAVLIKGGHLREHLVVERQGSGGARKEIREAIDLLDDEGRVTVFRGSWIDVDNVRGTGCMLSAAIAACLAKAISLESSVAEAKRFVRESLSR
jgi:hydroxymethylpyrimidine kinase/phosphomethylpyrimidine kinase